MSVNHTLATLELFEGLPGEALEAIATLCQPVTFAAQSVIFAMGQPAERVYVLLEGTVRLSLVQSPAQEPITITLLKSPGQVIGWSALIGGGHYSAAAQALTDVRTITIDGKALMAYLETNPAAGFVVMRRIAQIISQRMGLLRRLMMDTVRECDSPADAVEEN